MLWRRSVTDKDREWDFKVHKEIMFDEEAEPEQGTKEERRRICVPFPFELSLPNGDALGDFEIHVEGWKNFAYYSPGDLHRDRPLSCGQSESSSGTFTQSHSIPFIQGAPCLAWHCRAAVHGEGKQLSGREIQRRVCPAGAHL